MTATKTMTTTDLATELDTDPRTLRKFLRSADSGIEPVGKGKRYSLPGTKTEITKLAKRFAAWTEARAEAERKAAEEAENAPETEHDAEYAAHLESGELDAQEPTVEDLESLELPDDETDD